MVRRSPYAVFVFWLVVAPISLSAQSPQITAPVNDFVRVYIHGQVHPLARAEFDRGRVTSSVEISGATLLFKRSAQQESDLLTLLSEQKDPTSAEYRHWLSSKEFAQRFGVNASDISKIHAWLRSQGLTVENVSPSRTSFRFSGTVAQIETAFGTEFHHYQIQGQDQISNAYDLSVPKALAPVVLGVRNLNTFPLHPKIKVRSHRVPRSYYTYSQDGSHYLAPDDIATIYNLQPLYDAGLNGSGQKIAIVGQTTVDLTNVTDFRSGFNLSSNTPTTQLVPQTGSGIACSDDQSESYLDMEWAGAVGREASIIFVYAGAGTGGTCTSRGYGVFDALQYAIDYQVAPVISTSYGDCEADFSSSDLSTLQSWGEQANSQGQTIVASSGDSGAADCDYSSSSTTVTSATHGYQVDIPAALPYVTAIGGTEFNEGSGSYWNSSNTSNGASAKSYIPEEAWNNTTSDISAGGALAAGGGGKSKNFSKPSWQSATGVPNDNARDVPDLAFSASADHDGYLLCDQSYCANGQLGVAGGTSVGAPLFAGLMSILNQKVGSSQGNVNSTLYSTYSSSASSFHDVTAGDNKVPCTAGSTDCPSSGYIGYSAGTGYDLATGLGSLDAYSFIEAVGSSSSKAGTTTTVTVSSNPAVNSPVTFTATVTATSGSPTGTVTFLLDGANLGSAQTVSGGQAAATNTFTSAGTHTISATYSGDSNFASSSSSSVSFTVSGGSSRDIATTTGVTSSATSIDSGQSVTLMATTTAAQSSPAITGTVSFSTTSGSTTTQLGSAAVSTTPASSGSTAVSAAVTTSSLPTGANTITAAYSGDSNYAASSGTTTLTVLTPSFSLTAVNASASPGNSATSTVTVAPVNGFSGTVTLSVSLPSALAASTATIAPSTVTLNGSSSKTATATISTTKSSLVTVKPLNSSSSRGAHPPWRAFPDAAWFIMLPVLFVRRRIPRESLLCVASLALACSCLSACGGSSSSSGTSTGTYTISVTGTSGSTTSTTNFVLTVN